MRRRFAKICATLIIIFVLTGSLPLGYVNAVGTDYSESLDTCLIDERTDESAVEEYATPNYGILDDTVPKVDWAQGENKAASVPYYINEEVVSETDRIPTYDSRKESIVTPVKNQGGYGTCWAFSSISAVETNAIKKGFSTADAIDLSEYQLAYFTYHNVIDPLGLTEGDSTSINTEYPSFKDSKDSQNGYLGFGGDIRMGGFSLLNWMGTVNEEEAKYSDATPSGILSSNCAYSKDNYHVQGMYMASMSDKDSVKKLILDYGAAATSYYTTSSSLGYNNYGYYFSSTDYSTNHAIMLVGWDDNFSKDNFNGYNGAKPDNDGAWIVKNSWGTNPTYLSQGYFYLSYEEGSLKKATATAFDVERSNNYDYNYHYDGSLGIASYPSKIDPTSDIIHWDLAVLYTARDIEVPQGCVEYLDAVSMAFASADVSYTVSVYTDLTDLSNPFSGTKRCEIPGTTTFAGNYTIKLPQGDKRIVLEPGETFAVVYNIDSKTSIYVAYQQQDIAKPYLYTCSVPEDKIFIRENGYLYQWEDSHSTFEPRVKAFTSIDNAQDWVYFDLSVSHTPALDFCTPATDSIIFNKIPEATDYKLKKSDTIDGEYTEVNCTSTYQESTECYEMMYVFAIGESAGFYVVEAYDADNRLLAKSVPSLNEGGRLDFSNPVAVLTEEDTVEIEFQLLNGAMDFEIERKLKTGMWESVLFTSSLEGDTVTAIVAADSLFSGCENDFRVRQKAEIGESEWKEVNISIPLLTPLNFKGKVNGKQQINLSWNAVDNASSYEVEKSYNGETFVELATALMNPEYCALITDADVGKEIFYRVSAVKASGDGNVIRSRYAETKIGVLAQPSVTSVTLGANGSKNISWTTVAGAESFDIYIADAENGQFSKAGNVVNTTYRDSVNTTTAKPVYYKIVAIGSGNSCSHLASATSVKGISLPKDITVSNIGFDRISVKAINSYCLYAIRKASATDSLSFTFSGNNGTDILFSELDPQTEYEIFVKAIGEADSTAYCVKVTTTNGGLNKVSAPTVCAINYGQSLSSCIFDGGEFSYNDNQDVAVEYSFKHPELIPDAGTNQQEYIATYMKNGAALASYEDTIEVKVNITNPNVSSDRVVSTSNGVNRIIYSFTITNPYCSTLQPKDASVTFTVNGNTVTLTPDAEGYVKYELEIQDNVTNYQVCAVFSSANYAQTTLVSEEFDIASSVCNFTEDSIELEAGKSSNLGYTVFPSTLITYWSAQAGEEELFIEGTTKLNIYRKNQDNSKTTVLTIDTLSGEISAEGKCDIKQVTLSLNAGDKTDSVIINIVIPVSKIYFNTNEQEDIKQLSINVGETKQIECCISPSYADHGVITLTSSNPDIVSLNAENVLSAYAEGSVDIVATSTNGVTATLRVDVTKDSTLTMDVSLKIKADSKKIYLEPGNPDGKEQLKVLFGDNSEASPSYFEYISADENRVLVSETGMVSLNPKFSPTKNCTVKITARVRNDSLNRKVTIPVYVLGKKQVQSIKCFIVSNDGTQEEFTAITKAYRPKEVIKIQVKAYDKQNAEITGTTIKFSVNDTNAALLKTEKNNMVSVILKNEGAFNLKVKAQDQMSFERNVTIYTINNTPTLSQSTFSINKEKRFDVINTECDAEVNAFTIQTKYGIDYCKEKVQIKEVSKGTNDYTSIFSIKSISENDEVFIKADNNGLKNLANGTYNMKLLVPVRKIIADEVTGKVVISEESEDKIINAKIIVVSKPPVITIAKQQVYLFYGKNYAFSSNIKTSIGEITSIKTLPSDSNFDKYVTYFYNAGQQSWMLKFDSHSDDIDLAYSGKSISGEIEIAVEGYAPITKRITVFTSSLKPSLGIVGKSEIYVDDTGKGLVQVEVYDKTLKRNAEKLTVIDAGNSDRISIGVNEEKSQLIINTLDNITYRNKEVIRSTVKLMSESWAEPLVITLQTRIYTDLPKISVNKTSIKLNRQLVENSGFYSEIKTNRENNVMDTQDLVIEYLNPATKAYEQATSELPIRFSITKTNDKAFLAVKLADNASVGTYKLRLSGIVNGYALASLPISVTVVDKAPSISASMSGTLDSMNRNSISVITYKVQGSDDMITATPIISDEYFTVSPIDFGKTQIRLKINATIHAGKYAVSAINIDNQEVAMKKFYVTVKSILPKVKKVPTQRIYKSSVNKSAVIGKDELFSSDYVITEVNSLTEGFECISEENSIKITLTDEAMKPGTYKVQLKATMKDTCGQTTIISIPMEVER